jgi:uncharacterized protein YkwD
MGWFIDWLHGILHPSPIPNSSPTKQDLLIAINKQRTLYKQPLFSDDVQLDVLAQTRANAKSVNDDLNHGDVISEIEHIYPNTGAAENLAYGYPTADAVVTGWMGSLQHRQNILGPYNIVGIGIAPSSKGEYWSLIFDMKTSKGLNYYG